ncbi:MAG: TIGR04283 family arsenosugar biosynthesis glycosyltransferase [Pirellulales bacterium]|nr:TIGR04283 family arsenosugar biosynthesis glycosyltransferase [Pirellulales bacterium]
MTPADISVVIPAINEEASIAASVESALLAGAGEVIVCDGGSTDQTHARARQAGAAKIVQSLPGRGIQLNAGAMFAEGRFVLFLHADNRLGQACLQQICEHSEAKWGAFRQRIDSPRWIFRAIERGNTLRVQWRRMPFGDQAIFVQRELWKQQRGYAEIPLMEDVEFSKRLRKIAKPLLLDGPVTISARRWQKRGVLRQTLLNWSLQIAYFFGADPENLVRRYR